LRQAPTDHRGFRVFGRVVIDERKSPLLAKDARNGAPGLGFYFLPNRLLGWLKTTTSAEVGQDEPNLAATADLLSPYPSENT
jgi:hypothetical protein